MGEDVLSGYRGRLRRALEAAGAEIGDLVKIQAGDKDYEGILMPRLERADGLRLVIKQRNGYNIGITFGGEAPVPRVAPADKPEIGRPRLPGPGPATSGVSIISTG